jgi:hypothetical protein
MVKTGGSTDSPKCSQLRMVPRSSQMSPTAPLAAEVHFLYMPDPFVILFLPTSSDHSIELLFHDEYVKREYKPSEAGNPGQERKFCHLLKSPLIGFDHVSFCGVSLLGLMDLYDYRPLLLSQFLHLNFEINAEILSKKFCTFQIEKCSMLNSLAPMLERNNKFDGRLEWICRFLSTAYLCWRHRCQLHTECTLMHLLDA